MGNRKKNMQAAASRLLKYYGILTTDADVRQAQSAFGENGQSFLDAEVSKTLIDSGTPILTAQHIAINNMLINTSDGCNLVQDIIAKLDEMGDAQAKELLQVHEALSFLSPPSTGESPGENNANSPSKESTKIALLMSNSPRISLEHRNIEPAVIFLNGIPNVELNRAVPIVDIRFYTPRNPLDEQGRVQALSSLKFLMGSDKVEPGSATEIMAGATKVPSNKIEQPLPEDPAEGYTEAGMEMFTSPQTMVDANYIDDETKHSTPVLDKFRPFMTLKELEISIVGTKGLMSYKSGKIQLVLHDRSRLAEVADFLRVDLYGRQHLLIEYGWSHPDGNTVGGSIKNPYGDLIDGMRIKEKYKISNSTFNFSDGGDVGITLEIYMDGAAAFNTELISSKFGDETPGKLMQQISELQKLVSELSVRVNPQEQKIKTKKLHGHQFLDVASDAIHHMSLDNKTKKQMRALKKTLSKHETADSSKLIEAITDLYGEEKNNQLEGGVVQKYKTTQALAIKTKLVELNVGDDPWLSDDVDPGTRNVSQATRNKKKAKDRLKAEGFTLPKGLVGNNCSLGKLLLNFIGEPLANTGLYDEVQLITYGFNDFAGAAHDKNISEFAVNLEYFAEQLWRHRMEHISKSGNMNLNEFLQFTADVLLDDPAAASYGLHGPKGSKPFYQEVFDKEGTLKFQAGNGKGNKQVDAATQESRIQEALRSMGLSKWQPPIIEFYIETLGQEMQLDDGIDSESETGESILRIHVFDKTASSYSSLEELIQGTREGEIATINGRKFDEPNPQNGTLAQEKLNDAAMLLGLAEASAEGENALLEKIDDPNQPDASIYRISGGPRQLKDFLMKTTPYIIYGSQGTTIKSATLTSIHDSKLATINMLRSFNKSELEPNGENPGGLPLQIIPTEMNMNCFGCPIIDFTQTFFVDFQTGTSADALYRVFGVTHKFTPGDFTTEIKFSPNDGWGQYYSLFDRISKANAVLIKDTE